MASFRHSLAVLITCLCSTLSALCYYPDGAYNRFNSDIQRCPGNTNTCCYTNRRSPPGSPDVAADECLPNGICQNRYANLAPQEHTPASPRAHASVPKKERHVSQNTRRFYDRKAQALRVTWFRDLCAVQSWDGCLDVGKTAQTGSVRLGSMTPCNGSSDSKTWCCGVTPDCCGGPNELTIAPTMLLPTSSITSTRHSRPTVAPPGYTRQPATAGPDSGLTVGDKATIAGSVFGSVSVLLVIMGVMWRYVISPWFNKTPWWGRGRPHLEANDDGNVERVGNEVVPVDSLDTEDANVFFDNEDVARICEEERTGWSSLGRN
jgi:hypothetical protein